MEIVSIGLEELRTGTLLEETKMYNLLFGSEGKNLQGMAQEDWKSDMATLSTAAANYSVISATEKDKINNEKLEEYRNNA
jgi:hypothetical protein